MLRHSRMQTLGSPAANFSLPTVSLLMGLGSLVAAIVLLNLRVQEHQ